MPVGGRQGGSGLGWFRRVGGWAPGEDRTRWRWGVREGWGPGAQTWALRPGCLGPAQSGWGWGAGSASGRGAEGTRWREGETDGPSCRGRAARGGQDEVDPQPRRSVEEEGFEQRGTDWLAASARVGAQGQNAGCLEGLALLPEEFLHLVCGVDGVTSGFCRLSLATGNPQQLEEPPPRLPPTRLPSLYPRLPNSPPEGAPSLPLRDRALVDPPSTAQRLPRPAPSTASPEAGPPRSQELRGLVISGPVPSAP